MEVPVSTGRSCLLVPRYVSVTKRQGVDVSSIKCGVLRVNVVTHLNMNTNRVLIKRNTYGIIDGGYQVTSNRNVEVG